jgi:hypothetical protein
MLTVMDKRPARTRGVCRARRRAARPFFRGATSNSKEACKDCEREVEDKDGIDTARGVRCVRPRLVPVSHFSSATSNRTADRVQGESGYDRKEELFL